MRALIISMVVMLFCGCDSYSGKLTKASYEKIAEGQTRADVELALGPGQVVPPQKGEPTGFMGNGGFVKMSMVRWEDGKRGIQVMFFDDKVAPDGKGGALKEQHGL